MVYDQQAHQYLDFTPGNIKNPEYTLKGGEGLLVYALQEKQIVFETVYSPKIDLFEGVNLVGFAQPPSNYTAYDLLARLGIENTTSIHRFNRQTGSFETVGFDINGQIARIDFDVIPGEGYFIYMKKPNFQFQIMSND